MIRAGLCFGGPETIGEAVEAYAAEAAAGRKAVYYAGGTEIATMGRKGKVDIDTLIDLKGLGEVMDLGTDAGSLHIGAGLALNTVIDSGVFPLFSSVASGIADRTVRNRLSVGGNIAGRLPYREAVLPFLLCNARAVFAGRQGLREEAFPGWFDKRLLLQPGEFLVKFIVEEDHLRLPFHAVRVTGHSSVDYPIVHAAGVRAPEGLRLAASGLCSFPFRSPEVERMLNGKGSAEERVTGSLSTLPGPVRDDVRAGRSYRTFRSKKAFLDICTNLEADL